MCAGIENQQILANAEKSYQKKTMKEYQVRVIQMMMKKRNHIQRRENRNQKKVLTKTPKMEEYAVKDSLS